MPRLFIAHDDGAPAWTAGAELSLPDAALRHVQVLRLQPGDALTVFDGCGGEWTATLTHMGRRDAALRLVAFDAAVREPPLAVTLAVGMPANERMDTLVEKATELGVAAIQPLHCERSVLRLAAERAERRVAHWQAVAAGASEQSGRTVVPVVAPVRPLAGFLGDLAGGAPAGARWLLSPRAPAPLAQAVRTPPAAVTLLSGPEGGLSPAEENAARAAGFVPLHLGPRILRADTAPLAALALLTALA